jgi:hypothetical protein
MAFGPQPAPQLSSTMGAFQPCDEMEGLSFSRHPISARPAGSGEPRTLLPISRSFTTISAEVPLARHGREDGNTPGEAAEYRTQASWAKSCYSSLSSKSSPQQLHRASQLQSGTWLITN